VISGQLQVTQIDISDKGVDARPVLSGLKLPGISEQNICVAALDNTILALFHKDGNLSFAVAYDIEGLAAGDETSCTRLSVKGTTGHDFLPYLCKRTGWSALLYYHDYTDMWICRLGKSDLTLQFLNFKKLRWYLCNGFCSLPVFYNEYKGDQRNTGGSLMVAGGYPYDSVVCRIRLTDTDNSIRVVALPHRSKLSPRQSASLVSLKSRYLIGFGGYNGEYLSDLFLVDVKQHKAFSLKPPKDPELPKDSEAPKDADASKDSEHPNDSESPKDSKPPRDSEPPKDSKQWPEPCGRAFLAIWKGFLYIIGGVSATESGNKVWRISLDEIAKMIDDDETAQKDFSEFLSYEATTPEAQPG